jgi:hypothetical protein
VISVDAGGILIHPRVSAFLRTLWVAAIFAVAGPLVALAGEVAVLNYGDFINGNDNDSVVFDYEDFVVIDDDDAIAVLDFDDFEETTIIVRHRAVSPLSPSSRTIKADEFQGRFSDLPAVLETVSGINIRSMGGHGQYAESAIRGGSAMGLRVYLDGVLLTGASTGAVDLSKIPLDRIQEIRVTKSTSGLRQMGAGMGGVIELFTDVDRRMIGVSLEAGSFGYFRGGMIAKSGGDETIRHQFNIDASTSNNDYPFMHDNGTTIPTLRNPDPTWDDTLMRKRNNHYRSADAAYSLSIDINENHSFTQQLSAGAFEQGLFVYHYKNDQSGLTGGHSLMYSIDYSGSLTDRLTIGGSASIIYRRDRLSDPDGKFFIGGTDRELESTGGSVDFIVDTRYSLTEKFYLAGLAGTRFERHTQRNLALNGGPEMRRHGYRAGAETGLIVGAVESVLRAVYQHEADTSSPGFGYWPSDGNRYTLSYPLAEAVVRVNLSPLTLQFSAAASRRSPTFFERFGWSSGFLANPDLREEARMEVDAGLSLDMGLWSAAASVFAGRVNDKIKSIPRGGGFVRVMNFADTRFYGIEADFNAKLLRILTMELSGAYLNSVVTDAVTPTWIGRVEPFVPALSGYVKTEVDLRRFNIGHGVRYESRCYLGIDNRIKRPSQTELSAWASYRAADFLTLRYRVDNYLNTATFDFLDNPKPRRVHVLLVSLSF